MQDTFSLPMLPMPAPSPIKTASRPIRVLYAEDMKELRDLMGIVLDSEAYHLETRENGQLAFARLCLNLADFDLLITDHHMPVMNGLELVQHLRRLGFAGKIIVFTSELSPSIHAGYSALKVDRMLPKPIRPATLRQLLVELFPSIPGDTGSR